MGLFVQAANYDASCSLTIRLPGPQKELDFCIMECSILPISERSAINSLRCCPVMY